ncbi:vesicle-associated membrane protein 7-like [Branchiostoma floridae]|uniref:Vesicle-associated membrane protein 7 n=1 Tax=Branchiostoma floridae TaxID=7739 RepID=A0A9J7KR79_BRAFL|nr:vesicle-associated membrane protein 7-like [Branchiostoma floridae]XP_035668869.1 vesicle-associated membrane protein 7-like [Branchiostoma floridae]
MAILYSCIARGTTVLADSTSASGNFREIMSGILPNIPTRNDTKTTYAAQNYKVHVVVENGIIYICAADASFDSKRPFAFLQDIKQRFTSGSLASRAITASSFELNRDFQPILAEKMEQFSKPGAGGDQLSMLQSQVDEVKGVMSQNIEKVLARGDRLDNLMEKTDELEASADTFKKTARRVKKKYFWKNAKMMIILSVVVLVVLIILTLIILFSTGVIKTGGGGGDSSTTVSPPVTPQSAKFRFL